MTIFGASIGLNMCFFRQTLLSVCLVLPFALFGRPVVSNDVSTTILESVDVNFKVLTTETPDSFGTYIASVVLDASSHDAINDAPPTITDIGDQTIDEDTQTSILDFIIGDLETTDPALLTVTGTSDNQSLVPDANIVFGGSGANRNVQITPLADENGVAIITITVDDGTENNSIQFELTVTSINDLPTITSISDQAINQDASTGVLPFTITDKETPATSLTVTGTSDNTTLVPNSNSNIDLQGIGENRTVQVTPTTGENGMANITITVDD